MKKRLLSGFLILALILTALAGCSSGNDGPSKSSGGDDPDEQLLASGYYEVYDEDDELVGYLRVTNSKIVVYDKKGNEKDSLRYDYNEKKELYTLDDGELFGCEEFTVEKSRKMLILITEDDDEYTLEEISKGDIPTPGGDSGKETSDPKPAETPSGSPGEGKPSKTPDVGGDEPGTEYIKLPVGCYVSYDGSGSLVGFLELTDRTMIAYGPDGGKQAEYSYSYDRDNQCILETSSGSSFIYLFTYERGEYYMTSGSKFLLERINKTDIPSFSLESYYIGGNGSIYLYGWMPDALYSSLSTQVETGGYIATGGYTDRSTGALMTIGVVIASDDYLQETIDEVRAGYSGAYSSASDLLYRYFRDVMIASLGSDFPGDFDEGYDTINGLEWRYWQTQAVTKDAAAEAALLFWMQGSDMVVVTLSWGVNGSNYGDMDDIYMDILTSLELYG